MLEENDLTSRRYTISQLKTHEMCDSILEQLEKAISLKEDKKMIQSDEPKEKTQSLNFNKSILPRRGKSLAENNKVILKAVSDEDYENYLEVSYECAIMRSAFKEDAFK